MGIEGGGGGAGREGRGERGRDVLSLITFYKHSTAY